MLRPWIGQRVRWRCGGRVLIGHVITCAGPRADGTYDLIVERRRPGELHRLSKVQRGLFTIVREVHRYEMRLHTLQAGHRLGQPAVPSRPAPQTPVPPFPVHQPPAGAFFLRGSHGTPN